MHKVNNYGRFIRNSITESRGTKSETPNMLLYIKGLLLSQYHFCSLTASIFLIPMQAWFALTMHRTSHFYWTTSIWRFTRVNLQADRIPYIQPTGHDTQGHLGGSTDNFYGSCKRFLILSTSTAVFFILHFDRDFSATLDKKLHYWETIKEQK